MKRNIISILYIVSGTLLASRTSALTLINNNSQASVKNEVSVHASTGGNSASLGHEGQSESHVYINTNVNGQTVEHIDETTQAKNGEPKTIEKKTEFKSDDSKIKSNTNVKIYLNQPLPSIQRGVSKQGTSSVAVVKTEVTRVQISWFSRFKNYLKHVFKIF